MPKVRCKVLDVEVKRAHPTRYALFSTYESPGLVVLSPKFLRSFSPDAANSSCEA